MLYVGHVTEITEIIISKNFFLASHCQTKWDIALKLSDLKDKTINCVCVLTLSSNFEKKLYLKKINMQNYLKKIWS